MLVGFAIRWYVFGICCWIALVMFYLLAAMAVTPLIWFGIGMEAAKSFMIFVAQLTELLAPFYDLWSFCLLVLLAIIGMKKVVNKILE